MLSYATLARVSPQNNIVIVPDKGNLVFDTIVASAGGAISYDVSTGVITFLEAGHYYVDWCVTTQAGITEYGNNWALKTSISGLSVAGSSHTVVSIATGFAIIEAVENETVRLVNISDKPLTLSGVVKSKAALSVYLVHA